MQMAKRWWWWWWGATADKEKEREKQPVSHNIEVYIASRSREVKYPINAYINKKENNFKKSFTKL